MTIGFDMCHECRHYQGRVSHESDPFHYVCAAYPDGIPKEISLGDVAHLKPYPGDNNIQFEPKPGYDTAGRRLKP